MTAPDESFYVIGVATRTTNSVEADPDTARLPELWQRAYADPHLTRRLEADGSGFVAVLTDYESDAGGAYTQVVGVRAASPADLPEGLVAVSVPAANRRHVPARGVMPQALIAAWTQVWEDTGAGLIQRAYGTDVEVHSADGADVYLSIRD